MEMGSAYAYIHCLTWGTQSAYFCLGTHDDMESQHEEFGEFLQQHLTWQQCSTWAPMNEENRPPIVTHELVGV